MGSSSSKNQAPEASLNDGSPASSPTQRDEDVQRNNQTESMTPEGNEGRQEDEDAFRRIPAQEEDDDDERKDDYVHPVMVSSRGFSGAPKFSEFRRTVTSTNTDSSVPATPSKDLKPGTKDN